MKGTEIKYSFKISYHVGAKICIRGQDFRIRKIQKAMYGLKILVNDHLDKDAKRIQSLSPDTVLALQARNSDSSLTFGHFDVFTAEDMGNSCSLSFCLLLS